MNKKHHAFSETSRESYSRDVFELIKNNASVKDLSAFYCGHILYDPCSNHEFYKSSDSDVYVGINANALKIISNKHWNPLTVTPLTKIFSDCLKNNDEIKNVHTLFIAEQKKMVGIGTIDDLYQETKEYTKYTHENLKSNIYDRSFTIHYDIIEEILDSLEIDFVWSFIPFTYHFGIRRLLLINTCAFPKSTLNISGIYKAVEKCALPLLQDSIQYFADYTIREALKSAIAAIMSRNMSHNLGSHVVTNAKHQIEELEKRQSDASVKAQLKGLSPLLQYLQERQDFIAVIANDERYPKGPLNFKSAVFDILAMDGPPHRHYTDAPINNYILDNIVRSENIVRQQSVAGTQDLHAKRIELQIVKFDGGGHPRIFESLGKHKIGNEFDELTLSVTYGLNGRQALLTILENIIRNAAKHDKGQNSKFDNNTLLFSIIFIPSSDEHDHEFFDITICDNKQNFAYVKERFEKNELVLGGKLAPLSILRDDGGISRENKGLKEMLISLAWLKYGEIGKDSREEIDYDTIQNRPWELLEIVGVDSKFTIFSFDETGSRDDLSLGYRFRLNRYKRIHLLTTADFAVGNKMVAEMLSDLPGAVLYAVRQKDYQALANSSLLAAIPRLVPVADNETETTLAEKFDDLFEQNIRMRLRARPMDESLPLLRISENSKSGYDDFDSQIVVRDLLGAAGDQEWQRLHSGKNFIHYRHHYETIVENAKNEIALDLRKDAIFTEGISGGNFTNNLIRTSISRFSYLRIVEAALARIAIVDERLFSKFKGRLPVPSSANIPDNPYWRYLSQKGIDILNSDERGIFNLWGNYINTDVASSVVYDFISIHLGLIDKATTENTSEREKMDIALVQFGACYKAGSTKLAIHSGRGGLTEISESIAFVPLSGIEWALDNCKFQLSEFFHGLKYPPFGKIPQGEKQNEAVPSLKLSPTVNAAEQVPDHQTPMTTQGVQTTPAAPSATMPRSVRKIFLFTTYAFDETALAARAMGEIANLDIEQFASKESIREKAPDYLKHFSRIAHIDSTFFFHPCGKLPQRVVQPEQHGAFVSHLVRNILDATVLKKNELVELHLILHASDVSTSMIANSKNIAHPLIRNLKRDYSGKVEDVVIWWFSHDGSGIHGHILTKGDFFDGVTDRTFHLLKELARHTNTLLPEEATTYASPPMLVSHHELSLPKDFQLNSKIYLDRLALWQLSGASDQAMLSEIFRPAEEGAEEGEIFHNTVLNPSTCDGRLRHPLPLLVLGSKPLAEFGATERRAAYLDGGIWCRYADTEDVAVKIREQFAHDQEMGLYGCNNSKEYLEFWARMLINSRLGTFESSTHGKIIPIAFHSEGEMAKETNSMIKQMREEFTARGAARQPLIWKLLLIDDHATQPLSGCNKTKIDILRDRLAPIFPIEDGDGYAPCPTPEVTRPALDSLCLIKLHYSETKDEALQRLKRERFDIILLDYLLNKSATAKDPSSFDTSDELLRELKDAAIYRRGEYGPLRHLWFSNASAFAMALYAKMVATGMSYHMPDCWWMDKGACPVSTPELFRHNLLQFMRHQVEFLSSSFQNPGESGYSTLFDLLKEIYLPKNSHVRDSAAQHFSRLLQLKESYALLRGDIEYGMNSETDKHFPEKLAANPHKSEIVFSLFPDMTHYSQAFWDHLLRLIYHTAHGSPQDWPQMLVNFKEIKGILHRAAKSLGDFNSAEEITRAIEKCIIDLHARSHRTR